MTSPITLSHAAESAACHGSGSTPRIRNSGASGPLRVPSQAFTPRRRSPRTRTRRSVSRAAAPSTSARRPAPIHLHLPHPVLRVHESQREERILLARRLDVRHAVLVADHVHRGSEPDQRPLAVDLGKRGAQPDEAARRRGHAERSRAACLVDAILFLVLNSVICPD